MDRAMLERHLALAERHVAEGEDRIARHHQILVQLVNDGHELRRAKELMEQLEDTQQMYIADRDRIRAELAAKK